MDLKLHREYCDHDGIFSQMMSMDDDTHVCETLEHAYPEIAGDGITIIYRPKIPVGVYKCIRGMHQLHSMKEPFVTFEITGVAGHTNLLFHRGNFDKDSEGCILLGSDMVMSSSEEMIINSKVTFKKFMDMQDGVDEFNLTVIV